MPSVSFEHLVEVYRHTEFDPGESEGTLTLVTPDVLDTLRKIEEDERLAEDTNVVMLDDPSKLALGGRVRVRLAAPRLSLGLLVRSYDDLWNAPGARLGEPKAYYVIDSGAASTDATATETISRYRLLLDAVALFSEAASYVEAVKQELIFLDTEKVVVPVVFKTRNLTVAVAASITRLKGIFSDPLHADQKRVLLATAIVNLVRSQPKGARFLHLLQNLEGVCDEVNKGYLLFASSFSYSKIRNEIETARVDYISKIHKTLVDIQGQLLGIPIATIVVASQLKKAPSCGVEFWSNVAVLLGAWIFVILLGMAIINQWFTLSSISGEIQRQHAKLQADYAAISDQFGDVFTGLSKRIGWHRAALIGLGVVAAVGAALATAAFDTVTTASLRACVADAPAETAIDAGQKA